MQAFSSQLTLVVREWMLLACLLTYVAVFAAILFSHWRHHQNSEQRFHVSALTEMAWSLAPMVMVLGAGLAGVSTYL